jgi:hypothetical protein
MDLLNHSQTAAATDRAAASAEAPSTVEVRLGVETDEERVRNWARQHGQQAAAHQQTAEQDLTASARRIWSERKPFAYSPDQEEAFQRIFRTGFEEGWNTQTCFSTSAGAAVVKQTVESSSAQAVDETVPALAATLPPPAPIAQAPTASLPVRVVDERDEPYIFDECTVTITLQLLPLADGEAGREVMIGVISHLDAPLLGFTRLDVISPLPEPITELLKKLEERMPQMVRFHEEERARAKAATPKRAVASQSKTGTSVKGRNSQPVSSSPSGEMPTEQTSLFGPETTKKP